MPKKSCSTFFLVVDRVRVRLLQVPTDTHVYMSVCVCVCARGSLYKQPFHWLCCHRCCYCFCLSCSCVLCCHRFSYLHCIRNPHISCFFYVLQKVERNAHWHKTIIFFSVALEFVINARWKKSKHVQMRRELEVVSYHYNPESKLTLTCHICLIVDHLLLLFFFSPNINDYVLSLSYWHWVKCFEWTHSMEVTLKSLRWYLGHKHRFQYSAFF